LRSPGGSRDALVVSSSRAARPVQSRNNKNGEAVTITELGTIVVIYRAIAKFDAVFGDEKTPQMISIRICAGPRLQDG